MPKPRSSRKKTRQRIALSSVPLGHKNIPRQRTHPVTTIQEELQEPHTIQTTWWVHVVRLGIILILVIPCLSMTYCVIQQLEYGHLLTELKTNTLVFAFSIGSLACIASHFIKPCRDLFLPLYVLGHEITHAIFVFFCYGKVTAFNASHTGGYIIANRSNIVVALSPYIFPFWTSCIALIYFAGSLFFDLSVYRLYFSTLFGASWSFNLVWTAFMIPLGQTDLKENGSLLSLTIIYLFNTLILSALLETVTPIPDYVQWSYNIINCFLDIIELPQRL